MRRASTVAFAALIVLAGAAPAQNDVSTSGVFHRLSDRVIRIQVTEGSSATKVVVGSGFFVDDKGRLVTNYHVVSEVVYHPERYVIRLGDGTNPADTAHILALDVVSDLAVLQAAPKPRPHFTLGRVSVRQGERLYAMGDPLDLGLSIIEGTYNGLLQHTLYPRLHFTGSLNHGMSGGPTITAQGQVVGINVSTEGEEVSFLVPVERAIELVAKATAPTAPKTRHLLDEIRQQITTYQDVYLRNVLTDTTQSVDLGPFRVATQPAPFFHCWGDTPSSTTRPFERVDYRCSTDDELYVAQDQSSGLVQLTHVLLSTTKLGATRFYSLYASTFKRDNTPSGTAEHVTSWRCTTRNLAENQVTMRAVLCVRAYRLLPGLYDGVVKVAVLGKQDAGLVSTLTLSGVSSANIATLSNRFLGRFAWR